MQALCVRGGVPLRGSVVASGAKNAITKLIIASLLSSKQSIFFNVPDLVDVSLTLEMCKEVGMDYEWDKEARILKVQTSELKTSYIPHRFSGSNRVPILMVGALLSRSLEEIVVPLHGEGAIDFRPYNFHFEALKSLGATLSVQTLHDGASLHATAPNGLLGAPIQLPYPSVGATENCIIAAVTARGTTMIKNAAIEPEVVELILYLQKLGANIVLDTDRTITIQGTRSFHPVEHSLMSDRSEVASFASMALATKGRIFVEGAEHRHLITLLNAVREVGGSFNVRSNGIEFFAENDLIGGLHIETDVHPGFMTDWQQSFVVALTQAQGSSIVHETVFENRFAYVDTLKEMGAEITTFRQCLGGRVCRFNDHSCPHSIIVRGKTPLKGASFAIPDLKASFAYLAAALVADGESSITGIDFLLRGYEKIIEKMQSLGANISWAAPKEGTV
jgi:UDP-N-acetylglucosamine 1-carboxyvinyltransferase